jgi:hypothetical protein
MDRSVLGCPVSAGGGAGDAERCRGFFLGEAGKITQLDQLRLDRVDARKAFERLVQRQQIRFGRLGGKLDVGQRHPGAIPAVPDSSLLPGTVDQDAAHRLGGNTEEMSAIREGAIAHQTQVRLVHQGRRVERLTGFLARQLSGRKAA